MELRLNIIDDCDLPLHYCTFGLLLPLQFLLHDLVLAIQQGEVLLQLIDFILFFLLQLAVVLLCLLQPNLQGSQLGVEVSSIHVVLALRKY